MTRKLVTCRTVSAIKPIEGADNICLAIVDGWQCVVKKGEFEPGDRGLYFEIDSFLPAEDPRFKFLEKNFITYKNRRGARVKTIKLRGQLSQGLMLPKHLFPEIVGNEWNTEEDLSEAFKVIKWDAEEAESANISRVSLGKQTWLTKKVNKIKHLYVFKYLKPVFDYLCDRYPNLFYKKGDRQFPSFIPKTDEERIQNLVNKIDFNSDTKYRVSVKLDGSSLTAYSYMGRIGVCSRNFDLQRSSTNKYWNAVEADHLIHAISDLKSSKRNLAFQGELMGPGIRGNKEGLDNHQIYIFNGIS